MTDFQKEELLVYLKNFLDNPTVTNEGIIEGMDKFNQRRVEAIPELKILVDNFLGKKISIEEFKEGSEALCRKLPYWGFKGFGGQMQLNQYVNNIDDSAKEEILRNTVVVPSNEAEAKEKIDRMANYLGGLKQNSDRPKAIPRIDQSYLLSYFWEIQKPGFWPVHYWSTRKVLFELGFGVDTLESKGDEYLEFVKILNSVNNLYTSQGNKNSHPLWFIEHVFWYQFKELTSRPVERITKKIAKAKGGIKFGEWLPPIVSDLGELALNKDTEWSKDHNIEPDKAFETKLSYAFRLLGFETQELGQGTGREPDGVAIAMNLLDGDYYAIIYDAKSREGKYSIGTGDREISEYIQKKKGELRRKRINKVYFVIVSSEFDERDSNLNLIRDIKRKTQVSVTFLRAVDLLSIVEAKLQKADIDHGQLEYLFLEPGLISRDRIISTLELR